MRTFPKALSTFREIVNERGQRLRTVPFEQLQRMIAPLEDGPVEHLIVDSRPSTIGISVQPLSNGGIRVVVQGFMSARFIPWVKNVALDGFYKFPDDTLAPMPQEDFYMFD